MFWKVKVFGLVFISGFSRLREFAVRSLNRLLAERTTHPTLYHEPATYTYDIRTVEPTNFRGGRDVGEDT